MYNGALNRNWHFEHGLFDPEGSKVNSYMHRCESFCYCYLAVGSSSLLTLSDEVVQFYRKQFSYEEGKKSLCERIRKGLLKVLDSETPLYSNPQYSYLHKMTRAMQNASGLRAQAKAQVCTIFLISFYWNLMKYFQFFSKQLQASFTVHKRISQHACLCVLATECTRVGHLKNAWAPWQQLSTSELGNAGEFSSSPQQFLLQYFIARS